MISAIALTACAAESTPKQALSAELQPHLAKPVEPHLAKPVEPDEPIQAIATLIKPPALGKPPQ